MRMRLSGCRRIKNVSRLALAAASLLALSGTPAAASNILPGNWDVITTTGTVGTLRAGSPWGGTASLAAQSSIVDGVFASEMQTWNTGSWWWDEDASVNSASVATTIHLNQLYTIDGFVVQADNNDTYRLEYWNGAAWQLAWNVPGIDGFGLMTRTSGLLPAISTDFLRFTATAGDNYYAVSEIQAFGTPTAAAVPEPSTMLLLASGLVGAGTRRWRQRRAKSTIS